MISIDRDMLWQWDRGQRVQLHDVPVGTAVHFSNAAIKPNALVKEAYEDGEVVYADIPDILLQTAGTLTVYIYIEDGDEGHTEYRKLFIVRDRERPDDYVYTEDDVKTWEMLEERIKVLEESGADLPQSDWNQSDETAPDYIKNRTHYEEVSETSIEGMRIGDFPVSTSEAAHNLNVPLALGQVWGIYYNNGSHLDDFEVQQAEDGSLFLCGNPVTITADTINCLQQWVRMIGVQKIWIVGVSGSVTETAVKKIDPKFIPEWNELNGIPFGEETEEVTCLEPYTFNMTSTGEWVQLQFVSEIVVGMSLKVMWDGELYECVAHDTTGMVGFGNASLYGKNTEDTHEPFLVLFNGPSRWVAVTETGVHTISVVGNKTVVNQLDEKYIPDSIARKSDIPQGGGSSDIPSTLPNPNALTFTGAVEATYDGSTPVEVEIPSGGGGSENLNVRLVASVTIDPANPPESIIIDRDNDGNPFELKRAIIFTDIGSNVAYAQFVVNGAPWTYALKFNNIDGMIYAEFHDSIMFAISTFQGLRANILGYKTSYGAVANKAEYFGPARSFEILPAQGYSKGTFVHIFEVL